MLLNGVAARGSDVVGMLKLGRVVPGPLVNMHFAFLYTVPDGNKSPRRPPFKHDTTATAAFVLLFRCIVWSYRAVTALVS